MIWSFTTILASLLFLEQSGHALHSKVFEFTDSSVWNVLSDICLVHYLTSFMSLIKCHLINVAFPNNPIWNFDPCSLKVFPTHQPVFIFLHLNRYTHIYTYIYKLYINIYTHTYTLYKGIRELFVPTLQFFYKSKNVLKD